MYFQLLKRVLRETDKRLVAIFLWNMGVRGIRSVRMHKRRLRRGQFFPPFLHISITNRCNLRCQGCWVDVTGRPHDMPLDALDALIDQARAMGNSYFGLLGGEPLLHGQLLKIFERHRDCYFQLFTNGHFLTDEVAAELRRLGNVTPMVSIEGTELVSDQRRGGRGDVWDRSIAGLEACVRNKLLTGVCTSLCQSNIDDLLTEAWLDRLIEMGAFYAWYYIYRVVGPKATPELALTPEQQVRERRFVVRMRTKKPIALVDTYYDHRGAALCPAATGFTHHVSPYGQIEPCPVIQLATDSIHDGRPLADTLNDSAYLAEFRRLSAETTRGCLILERPDLLIELAKRHGATDTTLRGTVIEELTRLAHRHSQYTPGQEIPERSWAYWLLKRFWFNDFGVYAQHFEPNDYVGPGSDRSGRDGESEILT